MSRIVIFGITNLNFENLTDPSVKVYLVGTDYDYEDGSQVSSISYKNILDFYINISKHLYNTFVFYKNLRFIKNITIVLFFL
jgi:hypothetical protein